MGSNVSYTFYTGLLKILAIGKDSVSFLTLEFTSFPRLRLCKVLCSLGLFMAVVGCSKFLFTLVECSVAAKFVISNKILH